MKPRIRLTDQQLRGTDNLRARNYSWSAIGKELGIHRQIVKREYLGWEKSQVRDQLKTVRQQVAAEEFKEHLELLSKLAQELGDHLESNSASRNGVAAGEVFRLVLESTSPLHSDHSDLLPPKRGERFRRERRWLYDALEAHLAGTRWEATLRELERWRKGCAAALTLLEGHALRVASE